MPHRSIVKNTLLILLSAVGVLAASCGKTPEATKTILVVLKTLNNPYYIEMKRGIDDAAGSTGGNPRVLVEAFDREDDVEGQLSVITTALERGGLAAVSLTPASSTTLAPLIRELNDRGVGVVIVDTRMDKQALAEAGARVDAFVGSDNYIGGRLAGEFLGSELGQGAKTVLVLEGVPSQETAIARKQGFDDVAKERFPNWKIVYQVANWNREEGRVATESTLNTAGLPDGVFACNDEMALGAVAALQASGVDDDVWPKIVGFDATQDALRAIEEGLMAKTVEQQPYEMGQAAVELAVSLSRGESVKREQLIPVRLVPKENSGNN